MDDLTNNNSKKKKSPVRLIIVLVVAILLVAYRIISTSISRKANIATERVFAVHAITVEPQSLQEYFTVNGEVMAENSVNILPDIGGKLVQYTVRIGQNVTRGQIVAYVDASRPGAVYSPSPVRSPLAGTITSLPVELGNTVSAATVVATMGDLSRLKIETYVPERFFRDLTLGDSAELSVSAKPGVIYPATIVEMSPVVDPLSRTVWVKLYPNERQDLMAGMFGSLRINTIRHENALVVPSSAIITRSGQSYLAVLGKPRSQITIEEGSKTEEGLLVATDFDALVDIVSVTQGVNVGGMVLMTEGLEEGQQVVVSGQNVLSQDIKVRLLDNNRMATATSTAEMADNTPVVVTIGE